LDVNEGVIRCGKCRSDAREFPRGDGSNCAPARAMGGLTAVVELSGAALQAMRYILGCDRKKLFSFNIGDLALGELTKAAEAYLLAKLDRGFRTLEYYKGINTL